MLLKGGMCRKQTIKAVFSSRFMLCMPSRSPLWIVVEVLLVFRNIVNVAKTGLPYLEDIVFFTVANIARACKHLSWSRSHIVEADAHS